VSASRAELARYTHYWERYQAHVQSLKLEERHLAEAKRRAEEVMKASKAGGGDVTAGDYIVKAARTLTKCRRVLKFTYVHAFYLANKLEKDLFEHMQALLESNTENLARLIESPAHDRLDLINQESVAEKRLSNLLAGAAVGMMEVGIDPSAASAVPEKWAKAGGGSGGAGTGSGARSPKKGGGNGFASASAAAKAQAQAHAPDPAPARQAAPAPECSKQSAPPASLQPCTRPKHPPTLPVKPPTIAPPTIAVAAVAGRGVRLALPQPPAEALVPVAVSPGRGLLLRLLRQLVLGQRAHVVAGQGVVAVRVAALCGAQPQRLQQ
jgi:hypothetical protein